MGLQLLTSFETVSLSVLALVMIFMADTVFGLYLLVSAYKYQLMSLSLTGKYNYKIMKGAFKPTF
jgi:hypothetical protein